MKSIRKSTLETLGLGTPLSIFKAGRLPVTTDELVDRIFGPKSNRGALVISGGNGIVGSGKAMQLGARLLSYGVPIVTLDLPDAPAGLKGQYAGLKASFGATRAAEIMANVVQLNYDGKQLPPSLSRFNPRFVLEAIPEILSLKRSHYEMLRAAYPGVEIRSVTSGFPSAELGVGILHPSFPHQINKVWEVVEPAPSDITKLLWSVGMIPAPVGDYWSFVLDVLFCGVTLAALRYHGATNMPFSKLDKFVRRAVGPNPLRAHDAIGPGASFLTWSCLHHLSERYGKLFTPSRELVRRKDSGESWYPSDRPIIDWKLEDFGEFESWVFGPVFQMTSLLLHEKRGEPAIINAIGELCAQFNKGVLAMTRTLGRDKVISIVEAYHKLHPTAAKRAWHPEAFDALETPEGRFLYVNAEHDGKVGVISFSREALNWDVMNELNGAIDWLKAEGIERVIVSSDFHLSTQMVGADTSEFYPAIDNAEEGYHISAGWSAIVRRLYDEFAVSVGFIGGKRCLGGMLELMMHCHYLIAVEDAQLGTPEVSLPVVPGMEGCHLPFRRSQEKDWPKVAKMLLAGKSIKAPDTVGWLTDFSGPNEEALQAAWHLASGERQPAARKLQTQGLSLPSSLAEWAGNGVHSDAQIAIYQCAQASCKAGYSEALAIQAKHSAGFMVSQACKRGAVGTSKSKVTDI